MQIGIYMNAFNRLNLYPLLLFMGFPGGPVVKKLLPVQEMWVWSMGWDDPPGGGNDNPPQYPYLGNLMDRGAWWTTIHGVTKSQTIEHTHTHTHEL